MIRIFFEGGKIMIGATKEEFNAISEEGAKLELTPRKAKKLKDALDERLNDYRLDIPGRDFIDIP